MFCTCSGSTNGPASSTRMRRLRVASATNRCSAIMAPNVPPPTMMTSKSRLRPATVCALLSSASCRVLHRKRPILSRVKDVNSEVRGGVAMGGTPYLIHAQISDGTDIEVERVQSVTDGSQGSVKLTAECTDRVANRLVVVIS